MSDPLQSFSWYTYGATVLFYSAAVFSGEVPVRQARTLSRRNATPRPILIGVHLMSLLMIFFALKIAISAWPIVPSWLQDTFRARGTDISWYDGVFILALTALRFLERRVLFAPRDNPPPDADDASAPQGIDT